MGFNVVPSEFCSEHALGNSRLCVVVVVVEIIKLYLVQTGRFSATTGYVATKNV